MNPPPPPPPPPLPPPPGNKPAKSKWPLAGRVLVGFVILFVAFIGFRLVQLARYMKDHPMRREPGAEELFQAAKLIVGSSRGFTHGNTPEAQALAERLSREMKVIRETEFHGGNTNSIDVKMMTKGEFLVFCQLNEDSCAFLIHVPELKHYTGPAKEAIASLAYATAAKVLDAAQLKRIQRLAIATRGSILYDRILIGAYRFDSENPQAEAQVAGGESSLAPSLYPFFKPKPAQPPEPSPRTE